MAMMTKYIKFIAPTLSFVFISVPRPALAWGELGHNVVGEIAERILAESDRPTLSAVQGIIGLEPMQIAAAWPDKVRDDQRYSPFSPYHFATTFRDATKHADKDLSTVFSKYPAVVNDTTLPMAERAIALRFIIHMVGDAHQPLHVGNEFDAGANACTVVFAPDAKGKSERTNLHKIWDTDILNTMVDEWKVQYPKIPYFAAADVSRLLMEKYPELLIGPVSTDPAVWMSESADLRKTGGVYPDQLPEDGRPYCTARGAPAPQNRDVPKLGTPYYAANRVLVEKQLVKGGVRLAAFLKQVFKDHPANPVIDEKQILSDLQKRNDPPPAAKK